MRQIILVFLSLSVVSGCKTRGNILKKTNDFFHVVFYKQHEVKVPEKDHDPELKPYITQFLADAEARHITIPQETVDMLKEFIYVDQMSTASEPGVMAACTRYYTYHLKDGEEVKVKWMNIEVLRNEVQMFTRGQEPLLRELLYHELFHCFLNKGHLPDGVPGIMSPTLDSNSQAVFANWTGLLDEMFSPEYVQLIPDAT